MAAEVAHTTEVVEVLSRQESLNTDDDDIDCSGYARIVLIGVDGSPQSELAFRNYVEKFHKDGDFAIFVHAFELPLLHSFQEMYVSPEMWQTTLKKEADRTFGMEKRYVRIMQECQIPCTFLARGGKAGEVICRIAEDKSADLIVVGTRGHNKVKRAIIGSVSNYVTHHAPCPVLVSRPKGRRHTDSDQVSSSNECLRGSEAALDRVRHGSGDSSKGRRSRNASESASHDGPPEEGRKRKLSSLFKRFRFNSVSLDDDTGNTQDSKECRKSASHEILTN